MNRTSINIKFEDKYGQPYQGALVKARLKNAFYIDGLYVGTNEIREVSNAYGMVELDLIPSELDARGENYYTIEIIYDYAEIKKVKVPVSSLALFLNTLDEYLEPYERVDYLGDDCS
jgi:hypothetical protein